MVQPSCYSSPLNVQLSPLFLTEISAYLRELAHAPPEPGIHKEGVLFGTAQERSVNVLTFRFLPGRGIGQTELNDPRHIDTAIEKLLETSKTDPQLAKLQAVGWYSVQPFNSTGLTLQELAVHGKHFPHPTDIGLTLTAKDPARVLAELHTRSLDETSPGQSHNRRTFFINLDAEDAIAEPMELSAESDLDDFRYIRAYEALGLVDQTPELNWYSRIISSIKRPKSKQLDPDSAPDLPGAASSYSKTSRAKLSFVPAVALALVAIAGALSWLYIHSGVHGVGDVQSLISAASLRGGVGMRVVPQGDGLLVSWDRRLPVVRAAKSGVLLIDDGPQHRRLNLSATEIANGSVVYRPESNDVNLVLELVTFNHYTVTEHIRVLDGTSPANKVLANAETKVPSGKTQKIKPNAQGREALASHSPNPGIGSVQSGPSNAKQAATEKRPSPVALTPTVPPPALTLAQHAPIRSLEIPAARVDKQPDPASKPSVASGNDLPTGAYTARTTSLSSNEHAQASTVRPPSPSSPSGKRPGLGIGMPGSPRYVPPRVLNRVLPDLSSLGASTVYGATDVAIQVRIDENGRVTQAQALNNNASRYTELVTAPALLAARRWTFDPAKSRGVSVASERTIVFHFAPRLR